MEYEKNPNLQRTADGWQCPVCGREWERHGGASGFVKAGAHRHVFACWEKTIAARSLVLGQWVEGKGYELHPKGGDTA